VALPRRWRHSEGVHRAAEGVGTLLREDSDLLLQAAVLHAIGYAPPVVETGFHAVDGARYLRSLGLDPLVVNLVAHHSCAR
jgi:putative nucleotidyltransferase with HDIG domain